MLIFFNNTLFNYMSGHKHLFFFQNAHSKTSLLRSNKTIYLLFKTMTHFITNLNVCSTLLLVGAHVTTFDCVCCVITKKHEK